MRLLRMAQRRTFLARFLTVKRRFLEALGTGEILSIKWNLVVRWWLVVVVFYVPIQYSTVQYSVLSSGLTSKNASKKNSHQAAKETAHVNATR